MDVPEDIAKQDLEALIDAVLADEEVVITRGRQPLVKLVGIRKRKFKFGLLEGKVPPPPDDFFDPLSEEKLALWEGPAEPDPAKTRERLAGLSTGMSR